MINFFQTSSVRNTSFLNYCFLGIVLNITIYLYKINYELGLGEYNFLFGIGLVLILLSPVIDYFTKKNSINSDYGVRFFLYTSALNLIALIYFGGGLEAPGLFWLSAIPITYGFVLNAKGLKFGFGICIATLLVFSFSKNIGLPQFQLKSDIFHR